MKFITQLVALLLFSIPSFSQNDVMINAPSIYSSTGDVINVPITIDPNGNAVAAFSFSLYYDPFLLEAIDHTAVSGWPFSVNLSEPGRVRASGFNLSGESSLFDPVTVVFNVIGNEVSSSPLTLDISALASSAGSTLSYASENGNVFIGISSICQERDSLALVALYNATDGANWNSTWDLSQPMNVWPGITLSESGCVINLTRSNSNLTGSLPSEIGNLIDLKILNLTNNNLVGNIPQEIGNLVELEHIFLEQNQLTGSIPAEIGNLDNLKVIHFAENQLNGFIPTEVDNLNKLEQVTLSFNQLSGDIPAAIFNSENLVILSLNNNQLSGNIPTTIGNPNNLRFLSLNNNNLNGNIPIESGNLCKLESLSLHNNQLNGAIPNEIGNLDNLEILSLYGNELSGNIPPEIGNLSNIEFLYLQNNQLNGAIPNEIGNLRSLSRLYLYNNQLSNGIPSQMANLEELNHLIIYNNQLSGCYHESLIQLCGQLAQIQNFLVSNGNNFDTPWVDFCNSGAGTCVELVWPGDFDYNGTADENDALIWGLAFGNTGEFRPNATTDWEGQQISDWTVSVEGINGKHQDGNGDGVIEVDDLQVLEDNLGSIHDNTNSIYTPDAMVVQFEEGGIITGNPSYDVYVTYDDSNPIMLHGVSGVVEFGNWQINDVSIDINNSSLEPSDVVKVYDQTNNRLHFALTRTDKVNKQCDGPIAKIIVDTGISPTDNSYSIDIQNASSIRANGDVINGTATTFYPYIQSNLANNNLVVAASVVHQECTRLGSITLYVEGGAAPYIYNWNTGVMSDSLIELTANLYEVTVTDAVGQTETLSIEVEDKYNPLPDEHGNYPDCLDPICPTLMRPDGNVISGTYQAETAINSIGYINGNVEFKAGEIVLLRGGFEVLQDKIFTAYIEDCDN